ncbi:hypothetical protein Saso_19640 [Streptomyces asoensis]|uniref:Uncharacterized protein n=1 Tax=Streptomyces asoensis TaxID=249586 RepID=A0ABQ3RWR4_9ACTN|nr:hypothetical protein GCM10010496_12230 [Streptomyces asoensis]GHI60314.1 hypothetical protein Saso_19640 [Streptomyces asoensis]
MEGDGEHAQGRECRAQGLPAGGVETGDLPADQCGAPFLPGPQPGLGRLGEQQPGGAPVARVGLAEQVSGR